MPKAKDLTHDLVHLRGHARLSEGVTPLPHSAVERVLAFNPWATLFWTLVVGAVVIQAGFIFWLI